MSFVRQDLGLLVSKVRENEIANSSSSSHVKYFEVFEHKFNTIMQVLSKFLYQKEYRYRCV